ncbi:cupin domain-containing protein [Vagococcus sp. BWB3-3]|uniref:Cupin domain-containing protein n=1 Tax=Vagococcus allomyrinae TaxID=2794353 RepID=A0A940SV94_9ENTE|nr:cupin domain-containing protein [Vagococcus allomyrinae]MBP1040856.1 cupin domain-containing protein [Vagococcus allomyrinae]
MAKYEELKNGVIFPPGEKNVVTAEFFTGQSYLHLLINDPAISVGVATVTFEPMCRNNWHIHHGGFQLLLVTGGEGWYQEEGQPARFLKIGDVVTIYEGIKHWHGATKDSWFEHIAITSGTAEWLEAVSEESYLQLDKRGENDEKTNSRS